MKKNLNAQTQANVIGGAAAKRKKIPPRYGEGVCW